MAGMVETGCQRCDFTGFLVREEGSREVAVPCACARRARGVDDLVAAGVPRRYLHCTLDNYAPDHPLQRRALATVREFVAAWPAEDRGLLLTGDCGTGKTHLATAVLRTFVLDHGAVGCFADYQDLLKRLQATFNRSAGEGVTEDDILAPVLEAELLVLDDLGSRRSTAWAEETLGHVLTVRYNEQRTTILTTNLIDLPGNAADMLAHLPAGREALQQRIPERTLSRIHEMCRVVHLEGADYRRRHR